MNAFLRQCVDDESPNPHPPVTLKSARLTFTPESQAGDDLPYEYTNTRRDHDEEHDAHPRCDVAEHFARDAIYIGYDKG